MSAIRGPGAMVAFDVVKSRGGEEPDADATKRVTAAALAEGLVLLSCGVHANTIRILMPLTISDAISPKAWRKLEKRAGGGERVERCLASRRLRRQVRAARTSAAPSVYCVRHPGCDTRMISVWIIPSRHSRLAILVVHCVSDNS